MHISQLIQSKYLRKEDCDPPILVTIDHLTIETIEARGKKPETKNCLHFKEDVKPMLLNTINIQLIARATGCEDTDDWPGREVVLYREPNVEMGGQLVGGIRVRAKKTAKKAPVIPEEELNEDDIPF